MFVLRITFGVIAVIYNVTLPLSSSTRQQPQPYTVHRQMTSSFTFCLFSSLYSGAQMPRDQSFARSPGIRCRLSSASCSLVFLGFQGRPYKTICLSVWLSFIKHITAHSVYRWTNVTFSVLQHNILFFMFIYFFFFNIEVIELKSKYGFLFIWNAWISIKF